MLYSVEVHSRASPVRQHLADLGREPEGNSISNRLAALDPSLEGAFYKAGLCLALWRRAVDSTTAAGMASKRKASAMATAVPDEPVDPADELVFTCLGGGNEVGRSCHIIQYKGKTVMLDAGQHPAYDGLAALPFFDDFDLSTVDVLLISQ